MSPLEIEIVCEGHRRAPKRDYAGATGERKLDVLAMKKFQYLTFLQCLYTSITFRWDASWLMQRRQNSEMRAMSCSGDNTIASTPLEPHRVITGSPVRDDLRSTIDSTSAEDLTTM